ncbi:MAG: zinc-ribbon domain-containing protein [Deltaproteobacteria bacterium]|nr:zinc-ribbon domain-containing protein [Deltaproteobacteria bacterium]
MIEVQCTSCHTRYRIDEQVLPEGMPTFKCSRCGHVFSFEPRKSRRGGQSENALPKVEAADESISELSTRGARAPEAQEPLPSIAGRMSGAEPSSSSQNSGASSNLEISDPSHAEAASSRVQGGPIEDEEAANKGEQSKPAAPEPQRPLGDPPHPAAAEATSQPPASEQLRAKQSAKSYPRPFTGGDLDAPSGDNLSFDFSDEEPGLDQPRFTRRGGRSDRPSELAPRDSSGWEVGEDDSAPKAARSRDSDPLLEQMQARRRRRRTRASGVEPQFIDDTGLVDEEEAPVYNRALTHSARFFLLLILLAVAGFGALTLFIHGAPAASLAALSYLPVIGDRFVIPATPAKLVVLRDVNAAYQHSKAGQNTLVISGTAENVGTTSLRIVQLTAALRDAQRRSLASEAVYCGNNVSAAMINQMTPHEIEFFQKLEPAKTFALEPSASCRFVAVFMNTPSGVHAYDVSVSQAIPGTAPNVEEPAS